jgi:hypothetical protein
MSYATDAPALPIFTVRQKNNRHNIAIHEPILFDERWGKDQNVATWMRKFTLLFEEYVKKHPDHYARFLYTIRKYPLSEAGEILKKASAFVK